MDNNFNNLTTNVEDRAVTAAAYATNVEEVKAVEPFYEANVNFSVSEWYNITCSSIENPPENFLESVLEPIISCCGIVGILLTMVVLSRKTMCTSTNCYLTALAVADLLFLVILSVRHLVERLGDCDFIVSNEMIIFKVYSIIVMDTFQYLTVGVTVMLAIERYIAICHPMRAIILCTVKRARIIIVVLTVVAFVLRSPKFFDLEIKYTDLVNGKRQLTVNWVYLYDDVLYTYIVTAGLLTVLPLTALLVLNIQLIVEIRRSSRYLQYHLGTDLRVRSVVSSEELKITVMLISVIIVFFICHVPYMVYSLITALHTFNVYGQEDFISYTNMVHFQHIGHILLALKSSGNFILYCWFSEKFWTTFMRLFCLRYCLPKQNSNHQPNGYRRNYHQISNQNNVQRLSCYITKETTC